MKKSVLKVISLVLCILTVLFCFDGCKKSAEDDGKNGEDNGDGLNYNAEWVVAPKIDAQIIEPLVRADFNEATNHYDISYADCFRIMTGDKYGIIDTSGNIVVDAEYDELFAIRSSKNFLGIVTEDDENTQTYIHYDSFSTESAYRKYNSEKYEYYWNATENAAVFVKNADGDAKKEEFAPTLPETVKGVRYSGNKFVPDGTFGLFYNSKNVTGMVYSGAGLFSDGLAAFKSNEKWGYVDSTGRTVIPFEYDAIPNYSAIGGENTPYESFEGYVTLKKDNKFGVCDSKGTVVVPFVYDGATPVVNGMLYVKTNGKWGVLCVDADLLDKSAVEKTTVTEKNTEETTVEEETTETTEEEPETEETAQEEDTTEDSGEDSDTGYGQNTVYKTGTYKMNLPEGGHFVLKTAADYDSEVAGYIDAGDVLYVDKVVGNYGHTVSKHGTEGWLNLKYAVIQ